MDNRPMIVRNLKHSMKALSSSNREVGSLTLVCKNSISFATSSTWCSVMVKGLVLGAVDTDWNIA